MTVNLDIKGSLAKLLSTEDLVVEHLPVETACFNVQTRVLTLPIWDKTTNAMYDLLVSHEVGHALFTPNVDWTKELKCPQNFLNVTEDVRVEKLIKRKYPGLPKTFYKGYKDLNEIDLFEIKDKDVNELNLADRINLHFKIGNFVDITFKPEEMSIVKMVESAETFEEAMRAAEALYEFCKSEMDKVQDAQPDNTDMNTPSNSSAAGESSQEEGSNDSEETQPLPSKEDSEDGEGEGSNGEGEDSEDKPQDQNGEGGNGPQGSTQPKSEPEVTTQDTINEKLKDLTTTDSWKIPSYIEIPKLYLDNIVIPVQEIHEQIEKGFKQAQERSDNHSDLYNLDKHDVLKYHVENWNTFRKEIQPEVNYIVKEFECKKSAQAYSRSHQSKTGVLDCTKLHTFKYNDDLFKKVTNIPEGKNHGLIFVLDWSGSMNNVLLDTVKQLLSLCMFCSKVNIPYEVYAFTHEYRWNTGKARLYSSNSKKNAKEEDGKLRIDETFSLMTLLSSDCNRKKQQEQMKNIFIIADAIARNNYNSIVPACLGLSGTPLDESLVSLHGIIPQFQKKYGVEKLNVSVLTDGEAAQISYFKKYKKEEYAISDRMGVRRVGPNEYLRNRKTGTTTKFSYERGGMTRLLLEDLQQTFPNVTITGFRIAERGVNYMITSASENKEDVANKFHAEWRKTHSLVFDNFGYEKLFVVGTTQLNQSTEFNVDEGASKAKIKSAFAKSLKAKKVNKKILSEFVNVIA